MTIKILLSTLLFNLIAVYPEFHQNLEQTNQGQVDSFDVKSPLSKNNYGTKQHFPFDSFFYLNSPILNEGENGTINSLLSVPHNKIPLAEPIHLEWGTLVNIKYKLKYFEQLDMELYSPLFSEDVKALDGKEVAIRGYVIPLDTEGKLYALSANPFAACFFCGRASPASVISLYFNGKSKRYTVDDIVKFRGVLHLNYDNPDENYYVLKDAQPI